MNNLLHTESTSFFTFNRKEWASFLDNTPLTLSKKEMVHLKEINNNLSMHEVIEIYLPLSKLLNLKICYDLYQQNILKNFLNTPNKSIHIPYVIGITGSVAAGKSTTAKILQALLSRWTEHSIVELVTTDGFLYSNQILKKRHLMEKKGFPQSYDIHRLINFIENIKSGSEKVAIPIYSHLIYDIVRNSQQIISNPDILILEGLNILQNNYDHHYTSPHIFVSDFVDFSIYIDAPEHLLQKWYINRFLQFCNNTLSHPNSYFYRYSSLSKKKLIAIATQLWTKINKINLQKNILPTRKIANLILKKGTNHTVDNIQIKIM